MTGVNCDVHSKLGLVVINIAPDGVVYTLKIHTGGKSPTQRHVVGLLRVNKERRVMQKSGNPQRKSDFQFEKTFRIEGL